MHHSQIVQDIHTAVHHALVDRLHELDEADLVERSDALLESLPVMGDEQPSTALLLRRYDLELHRELCQGSAPRIQAGSVEDELRELTRAVVVTMGGDEGLPVEGAALIALVLYRRGLTRFCATPAAR